MADDRASQWWRRSTVASLLLVAYGLHCSLGLYEARPAYVYDPSTDRIFRLWLTPSVSTYDKWKIFIPFREEHYGNPQSEEYLGRLGAELAAMRADEALFNSDVEAWRAK